MSRRVAYYGGSIIPSANLYIDLFPGAFQCCSVTLERTAYTGPLMAIRRSSDNAVKSFYPDTNDKLSMSSEDGAGTSLSTWIGANDGFVYNFYDQTGNGNDWLQPTAGRQVQIVSSGSLLVDANGLAAPTFLNVNGNGFLLSGFSGHSVVDTDFVMTTSDTIFTTYSNSNLCWVFLGFAGNSNTSVYNNSGSPVMYVDGASPAQSTWNESRLAQIGTSRVITHQGVNTTNAGWASAVANFGGYPTLDLDGILQFNASFASDQSANRAARVAYLQTRFQ